ncbi:MAG TPA: GatB/YqeY domain-containing protein [Chitinophagaceae bacterium]|nr:GatB/YqeY domain-containing protein [Chitinophagaceae bacterium]HNF72098.1 GatB/YqeY domain-containing protein [Chitinophagaceae bacterium]
MSLEIQINSEIKTAMLAKEEAALRGLRAIKSAILLAKTADGKNGELLADDEIKILQKLAKQRKDSIAVFEEQNRSDLAQKEKEELAVIEKFLPAQMSEEELKKTLSEIIASTGASGPADMGKVMGVATKQLAGKADGKLISAIVKDLLSA